MHVIIYTRKGNRNMHIHASHISFGRKKTQALLRLAVLCLLKCRRGRFLSMFAIKCSSFTSINQGTSNRAACSSTGHEDYQSVFTSNCLLERMLIIYDSIKCCLFEVLCCLLVFPFEDMVRVPISFTSGKHIRTVLLCLLTTCLGGTWCLEQPGNSILEFYPRFRDLLTALFEACKSSAVSNLNFWTWSCYICSIKLIYHQSWGLGKWSSIYTSVYMHGPILFLLFEVFKTQWWMHHYMACTPKRHYGYSNSPVVLELDKGKLTGWRKRDKKLKVETAVQYRDRKGILRYKGTKNLRKTEKLEQIYLNWNCAKNNNTILE